MQQVSIPYIQKGDNVIYFHNKQNINAIEWKRNNWKIGK